MCETFCFSKTQKVKKHAIIVAAGSGVRAGGGVPKQFHDLGGMPILLHSIVNFRAEDPTVSITVVLSVNGMEHWNRIRQEYPLQTDGVVTVVGGATRTESVSNALKTVESREALVAVHDAARPLVDTALIKRGWECADRCGACVPVVPVTDSMRCLDAADSEKSVSVDRARYVAVQTPQVFSAELLIRAYSERNPDGNYTDDASVVEPLHPIALFQGDPRNIKVTHPHDFAFAGMLLGD